jgi:hypothetical protein
MDFFKLDSADFTCAGPVLFVERPSWLESFTSSFQAVIEMAFTILEDRKINIRRARPADRIAYFDIS